MNPEHARALAGHVRGITSALDGIHAGGLSIPRPVQDAMQVLAAFGVALASNAQGQPTPDDARELLTCADCGGFGKHAPWCPE